MLYEILLCAYFSQSVKSWCGICDVMLPILYVLLGFGTNSSQCEIYEVWNLRFNIAIYILGISLFNHMMAGTYIKRQGVSDENPLTTF